VRAARERWKRGPLERKWGRGRGRVGFGAQVARGGSVASSTRDVGAQLGRRLREDDGADKPGPRAEREGRAEAGA
jgi:hypothetical protein